MRIKGKRIFAWILASIVALLCFTGVVEGVVTYFTAEKLPIYIYSPNEMSDAWNKAMSAAELKHDYQGYIVDNQKEADVVVDYGKENDNNYKLFAYSPFTIAYSISKDNHKAMSNAGILTSNKFDENCMELELLKVIQEVNGEGSWDNLGLDGYGKIQIFYPAESTVYWHDFYNFMLLTANDGVYPTTQVEMKSAVDTVQKFIESPCTEAIESYQERVVRTGGIPNGVLYIGPEQVLRNEIVNCAGYKFYLAFPKVTSNFNYYVKSNSEIGNRLISGMSSTFYNELIKWFYRNDLESKVSTDSDNIGGLRNVYESQKIPKENYFTMSFSEDNSER